MGGKGQFHAQPWQIRFHNVPSAAFSFPKQKERFPQNKVFELNDVALCHVVLGAWPANALFLFLLINSIVVFWLFIRG